MAGRLDREGRKEQGTKTQVKIKIAKGEMQLHPPGLVHAHAAGWDRDKLSPEERKKTPRVTTAWTLLINSGH